MDAFIDKLSYIAWGLLLGLGLIALIIVAVKEVKYRIIIARIKYKLDAWYENVLGFIYGDLHAPINTNLDEAISKLKNGSLDSSLQDNDKFFYLTEALLFNELNKWFKPIRSERYTNDKDTIIAAVKKFYFYMTKTKHFFKMNPKLSMTPRIRKGMDRE